MEPTQKPTSNPQPTPNLSPDQYADLYAFEELKVVQRKKLAAQQAIVLLEKLRRSNLPDEKAEIVYRQALALLEEAKPTILKDRGH